MSSRICSYPSAPVPSVISSTLVPVFAAKDSRALLRSAGTTDPSTRSYLRPAVLQSSAARSSVFFQTEKTILGESNHVR